MKKLLLIGLLATNVSAQANDDINYNYLELGYGYIDLGRNNIDGLYIDGSVAITDSFYLGGYYDNKGTGGFDLDRYGAFFGYHRGISNKTDFYSQIELGQFDNNSRDSFIYGLNVGTRTNFNQHFELITKAGYTQVDDISDGYFEAEVKGLFKFNEKHAISTAIESIDGNFGVNVGYRRSF